MFKLALSENIGLSKIGYIDDKINYSNTILKDKDVSEFTKAKIDSLIITNGIYHQSEIFYKFSLIDKTYIAMVIPFFDESFELKSVSLILPQYSPFNSNRTKQEVHRRISESKEISHTIIQLYSKKYGQPIVEKEKYGKLTKVLMESSHVSPTSSNYDYITKLYYYFNKPKNLTIEISTNCCADFNTIINYQLYEDYITEKKATIIKEKETLKKMEKNSQKTFEDI